MVCIRRSSSKFFIPQVASYHAVTKSSHGRYVRLFDITSRDYKSEAKTQELNKVGT